MFTFFSWDHQGPIPGHDDVYKTGIVERRRAIVATGNGAAAWLGYERQYRSEDEWNSVGEYATVGLAKKPNLGIHRTTYDGEHLVFWLGFLFVAIGW